jgi:hypothetical protein
MNDFTKDIIIPYFKDIKAKAEAKKKEMEKTLKSTKPKKEPSKPTITVTTEDSN